MSSLQPIVSNIESQMEIVRSAKPWLIKTVLPTTTTSTPPAIPPGLAPLSDLPSGQPSPAKTNALLEVSTSTHTKFKADSEGPRDKRQSKDMDKGSSQSDS